MNLIILAVISMLFASVNTLNVTQEENKYDDLTNNRFLVDCLTAHNDIRVKHCANSLKYSEKVCEVLEE